MPRSIRSTLVAVAVAALTGSVTAPWSAPVRAAELAPESSVLSPNPSSSDNGLFGVSAESLTDGWAVGSSTDNTTGLTDTLALHWDGSSWSTVPSPDNPDVGENLLGGVSSVSPTDAWAVGEVGDIQEDASGILHTLILHWDGTRWSTVPSPSPSSTNNFLNGVSADSSTDAWAIGGYLDDATDTDHPLILHWDGTAWSQVASPTPGGQSLLFDVSANSASDAWAVGLYGKKTKPFERTLILHWDGTRWSKIPSPNPSGTYNSLESVSADSPTDAWAVGDYHKNTRPKDRTLILHFDGTAWSKVPSPSPSASYNDLYGVSADSPSDAWAVGTYQKKTAPNDRTLSLHWDGTSWSMVPSPSPSSYHTFLNGVSANSPTDAWAVGYYSDLSTGINLTLILHWDGTSWSQV